jgi:hypothetical protein
MRRNFLTAAFLLMAAAFGPAAFAQETTVTAAAGGIFPPATSFMGVPITGLKAGFGLELLLDGTASGQFLTVLVGVSALGSERQIVIEGQVTAGSKSAANFATFSGTCTINLGDGSPPLLSVPFIATVTAGADGMGTLGLVLGETTLPAANVDEGSMTIQ